MRFLSVCSGIEAASVAWAPLGWEAVAVSEIEKFPSAVLAHHYPRVANLGDMTRFKEWPDATVDVLVGGTPCQSFSVAGLRKGLADPRGNLALTYLAIADRYRPEWLVWENVPGVLSSDKGRDFGSFLGGLGELGYGFAYRVLDAQYYGVAQRRRRVFVIGCARGWQRAAAVLFERESLRGDPAPRREAREEPAQTIDAGLGRRRGSGLNPNALAYGGNNTAGPIDIATAVNAHGGPHGRQDFESETFIAFDTTQITSRENRNNPQPGDPCHPLVAGAHPPAIAFNGRQDPDVYGDRTGPLDTDSWTQAVSVSLRGRDGGGTAEIGDTVGNALRASQGGGDKAHVLTTAVRRLTPRECERLQGFPDDYTLISYRGKPAADGPRYKALGNSMAVPVMRWIGMRIQMVATMAEAIKRSAGI